MAHCRYPVQQPRCKPNSLSSPDPQFIAVPRGRLTFRDVISASATRWSEVYVSAFRDREASATLEACLAIPLPRVTTLVTDLDDESTNDVGVDGVGDLELLALADVGRLGDSSLESGKSLVVKGL